MLWAILNVFDTDTDNLSSRSFSLPPLPPFSSLAFGVKITDTRDCTLVFVHPSSDRCTEYIIQTHLQFILFSLSVV